MTWRSHISIRKLEGNDYFSSPIKSNAMIVKVDQMKSGKKQIPYLFSLFILLSLVACEAPLPNGDADNGGLVLPGGFEALVVADSIGKARHLAISDHGDIHVKLRFQTPEGENVALRDTNGDGKADSIKVWGLYDEDGRYSSGMEIHKGYLYTSTAWQVYRHKLLDGELLPTLEPEIILADPIKRESRGAHLAKAITFDQDGHMYIPFGSHTDVCQEVDRSPGSKGENPCTQLEWSAGIWQFDDEKPNQTQADGKRYVTGIRSVVGMSWNNEANALYALQHGRDNLHSTWPDLYSRWQSAMLPSEEFLMLEEGANVGWPYYYYDQILGKKVLGPEYGGDGIMEGDGAKMAQPAIGFPGHWAPNDLLFYDGDQFPERYRNGAFIAFHGSTIRAPYPQSGYFIGFVPFQDGKPSGPWEVFADGFGVVDTLVNTSDAAYRPMGLAVGPDGSLYITESEKGKIWRVMFKGDKSSFGEEELAIMERRKQLPHIKTPDEIEDNLDKGRAIEGEKLYVTFCGSCHLGDGKGDGTRYPSINNSEWVSGDKRRLISILLEGLSGPLEINGQLFDSEMPAFNFLEDEQIAKILTYIRGTFGNDADGIMARDVKRIRNRLEREKPSI